MKKVYRKPQIVFDSFELSQSIAADCKYISNFAWQMCPIPNVMDETLFASDPCTMVFDPTSTSVCYDIPVPDSKVFSS